VRVEDHPLDHALFEGEIPPGPIRRRHVEIWDSGWYELGERVRAHRPRRRLWVSACLLGRVLADVAPVDRGAERLPQRGHDREPRARLFLRCPRRCSVACKPVRGGLSRGGPAGEALPSWPPREREPPGSELRPTVIGRLFCPALVTEIAARAGSSRLRRPRGIVRTVPAPVPNIAALSSDVFRHW
jgi:hypothetical protein